MVFLTSYQTFLFFSYRVLRLEMAIKKYILSKLVCREKRTYKNTWVKRSLHFNGFHVGNKLKACPHSFKTALVVIINYS